MFRDERYQKAKYMVKINHFTEQGFDITGVVHVGTNYGFELQWYQMMGIEWFIGFEPLPAAIRDFHKQYAVDFDKVIHLPFALSDYEGFNGLYIAPGDGQGSSFKEELSNEYPMTGPIRVPVYRFDTVARDYNFEMEKYDCLVVDVQGMELEVLKGMGELLKGFKFLNIECSEKPVYRDSASGQEIVDFLKTMGFKQDSPMEVHNDVFFIREDLK